MPNELDTLVQELEALRACPWDLSLVPSFEMHELLRDLWIAATYENEVDNEAHYTLVEDDGFRRVDESDVPDLRAMLINMKTWHSRVRDDYKGRTRRFAGLRLANNFDYGKHAPPPGMSDEQVVARPQCVGRSLFFNNVRFDTLEAVMFFAAATRWERVRDEENARIYVDVGVAVGASRELATSCLAVEINTSTPIGHVYPVGIADLRGEEPVHAEHLGPLIRSPRV
jgi:hypothetical protein